MRRYFTVEYLDDGDPSQTGLKISGENLSKADVLLMCIEVVKIMGDPDTEQVRVHDDEEWGDIIDG